MTGFELRPMEPSDAVEVAALDRICLPEPWGAEVFEQHLRLPTTYALTAVAGSQVVGYLAATVVVDEAHLNTLGVSTAHRRQGVARALLSRFLTDTAERGVRRYTLEVRAGNAPAIALYAQFGFGGVARRRGYYSDGEDALVLWRLDESAGDGNER